MRKTTLKKAVYEAKRFIETAEALQRLEAKRIYAQGVNLPAYNFCPKEQGAVKRASLDLTRKLADLRAGR